MAAKKQGTSKSGKTVNPAQEALQITFVLMGNLKRAQLMYLFIARQLAEVRDRSLYAALGHKDMEDYAHQRLDLGRSSLYNYLHIYDWVSKSHPEWLGKNVKGKIPDLSDVGGLIWLESSLADTGLTPAKRAQLEKFHQQALDGNLRRSELEAFKKAAKPAEDPLAGILGSLRELRQQVSKVKSLSPEALTHLDAAISLLANEKAVKVAGLSVLMAPSATQLRVFPA